MFKALIPAAAAIALVAFAARPQTLDASIHDVPTMTWRLNYEDQTAKLTYGVDNSDQLALMITCQPGEPTAVVYGYVQPDSSRLTPATLGPTPIDPLSGGDASESLIALNDPTLAALARDGALRVVGEAGSSTIPASVQERRLATDFLAYCGSARV